jgi:hypothetical protein
LAALAPASVLAQAPAVQRTLESGRTRSASVGATLVARRAGT